jgi:predicted NUDIX family NTP pyrophosphohydrolase
MAFPPCLGFLASLPEEGKTQATCQLRRCDAERASAPAAACATSRIGKTRTIRTDSPTVFAGHAVKTSAGTLLYRSDESGTVEVLIVHPSGNYNRRAPWSIPKGLRGEGESEEAAARRETLEETGVAAKELSLLGEVQYQKSRKRIVCFAGPAPAGAEARCASWEVDRAEFVAIEKAAELLHVDQRPLLEKLAQRLGGGQDA